MRQHNRDESDVELTLPTNLINLTHVQDIPPDGGYGWVCTACVFLVNAHTWGINSVRATKSPRRR